MSFEPYRFTDSDWEVLLSSIRNQQCLPFLGAGACVGSVPLGGAIAESWAQEYDYPLADRRDLIRVSQYVALVKSPVFAKSALLSTWFTNLPDPSPEPADEPHAVLAELPLPIYMTTNYDDFMVRALQAVQRNPRREMCRWNYLIEQRPTILDTPGESINAANPVVFHLHGHNVAAEHARNFQERQQCAASLVLTEDDYLELHVALNRPGVIPQAIRNALVGSSLLVIGYSLADTTFRALYRGLVAGTALGIQSPGYVVMPPPPAKASAGDEAGSPADAPAVLKAQAYLEKYFDALNMRVYWGDARTFARELKLRWQAS
jgi:hypothetical protein